MSVLTVCRTREQVSTHSKWDNGTGQYMSVLTVSGTMEQVSTGQYRSGQVSTHSMQDKGTGQQVALVGD